MHGEFGGGVAELVTRKLAPVGRHAHAPVLDVHVSLSRREGPAPENAVAAEVALDVNGRHVFAEASAATLRTAVDRVVGRLVSQLDRR